MLVIAHGSNHSVHFLRVGRRLYEPARWQGNKEAAEVLATQAPYYEGEQRLRWNTGK